MELFFKGAAGILLAAVLELALKKQEKDVSTALTAAVIAMAAAIILRLLEPVLGLLDRLQAVGNLNGCTIQNGTATAKTSDGLKALTSEDLGGGFAADTNGINSGYPVLAWQNGTVKSDDPEKDDNGWQGEAAKDAPQQKDGVYQIGSRQNWHGLPKKLHRILLI